MIKDSAILVRWAGPEPGSGYEVLMGLRSPDWFPMERQEIERLHREGNTIHWNPAE